MKRILLYTLSIGLISCNIQTYKPVNINEVFEPTDEELFAACAELNGLAQFHIGETTIKDVLHDKDYRESGSLMTQDSNFYNGHWGFKYWSNGGDGSSILMEKADWINTASSGSIKQLLPDFFGSFTIGEVEFKDFNMAFLNDTLVAIFFYPEEKTEADVINHFKEKYGNGRGHYKWYDSNVRRGDKVTATNKLDEKRLWANEKVALNYCKEDFFHMAPGQKTNSYHSHSMIIYSKKRYPVFEQLLMNYATEYDKNKKAKKDQAINAL